jgi:hypothetical protein
MYTYIGKRVSYDTYSASPVGNILSNLNIEKKTENEYENEKNENHFMGITNGLEKIRISALGDLYTQVYKYIYMYIYTNIEV